MATRDAVRLTARGTEAAQRAAEATERAVAETTRIGEAQVRAYLTIQDVYVAFKKSGFRENEFYIKVSISVQNSGNSPARDFSFNASAFKIIGEDVEQFSDGKLLPPTGWGVDVAPGDLFKSAIGIHSNALTEDQILALKQHTMILYVTVYARFFDVFGRGPIRLTGNYTACITDEDLRSVTAMYQCVSSAEDIYAGHQEKE